MGKNRKTIRLQNWDYRSPAQYFITICTKNREPLFGEIIKIEMHLNELGSYASQCLNNINIYNKNADVPVFIIMPNHIHAIIELKNKINNYQTNKFDPLLSRSISSVLNIYKGRVTKYAKENNIDSVWQARFYDHILKDPKEYEHIANYIKNNPRAWDNDLFNSQ